MKKPWGIVVSAKVEPELAKKIKKLLKPHRSVGRVEKCIFCGVDTTWTLNSKPACPKCSVQYGFLGEQWLLDPCEVCGKQGEWATDGDPQHFLCYQHRDDWLHWDTDRKYLLKGYEKLPEAEKELVWEKCFNTFIQEAKQRSEGER
ncbi:hypothetical protein ES705_25351 [subsurface metagenome]